MSSSTGYKPNAPRKAVDRSEGDTPPDETTTANQATRHPERESNLVARLNLAEQDTPEPESDNAP